MGVKCPKCQHENPEDTLYCGQCGGPLKSSEGVSVTKTLITPKESLQKGSTIAGKYKIIEELGRGGMGVVYKTEDTKLRRTVALKFLPPELTHIPDVKERFMREAQAAAALDHPNICTVYEFDEDEEKSFISMAYIQGQNLRKKIESGPLELEEALRIATQVAEGLQEAHKKGVVHRDIKSGNIMIDARGQAKIMDFGLARMTGTTLLTQEGAAIGTIAYMSPEQARGKEVDHRTDIWSLGVVLYEMLTGKLPFKGDHEQAVVYSILKEKPEPISGLKSDIPVSIEQVVSKALEKDKDKRYQQVEELLDDLKSISAGIVPEEIKARLRKAKLRKRKRALLYGGVSGLVIAAVVIALLFFTGPAEAINSIAVLPLENLTGDAEQEYLVDGVTDELIGQLGQISALRVISRQSVMRYKGSDKTLPKIARDLNVDALVEGSVQQVGNSVRIRVQLIDALPEERNLWGETYESAKTDLLMLYSEMAQAIADKIKVSLTAEESTRLTKTRRQVDPEAYEAYLKGQFHWNKFNEQDIEIALQYYELALDKDPNYAPAYAGIASYWGAMSYFGMLTSEIMPERMAALEKCLELDSMLPEAHDALAGTATWFEFDWDKAEREFLLTLELNPNNAGTRIFYGLFLTGMGRFEEAKKQMEIGLELDPLNAMHQGYLGNAFLRARQFDQAIAQYKKSLALQPDFADSISGLLECYHQKGMYKEALEVARKFFNARDYDDLLEAFNHGNEEGGYKEAMRQAAEAWAAQSNRAYSMRIATLYIYAGEKDRALDWLEIAFQERMQNLVYLNVQPKWDPLRDDPRFQDLIRRMHFPVDEKK
jgi:TolB-like protein/Tfp pilus assembly protein PilF/predicted Ser/Thr protein kinase